MILIMKTIILSLFLLNLDITPDIIFKILKDIIKRNSVANIINNDNNTKTKCCVTEDIDHDKITAIYLTNQSIRSV